MKIFTLFLTSFVALSASAQTTLTDADLQNAYTTKNPSRISVHDPSIFIDHSTEGTDDPTYYIYGSHRAGGSTKGSLNYQRWTNAGLNNSYTTNATQTVKNYKGETVTFGNFDAHAWQAKNNSVSGMEWAPDIIWNKTMNKYCMYMSVNGDSWCSSIVLLTSDSPKGPWTYQGPVVFSGFQGQYDHNGFTKTNDYKHTDLEIAIGEQTTLPARYKQGSRWGEYWPNCIDPCVFYDTDDKLWLSYGSWSGGIFMFELDEATGLRDYTVKYESKFSSGSDYRNCTEDPYFGKKIAGGWYNSGEASYIQKIGKYYYLFMSYGGLSGYGDYFAVGYQMRVFRSENPDGPYVDCLTTTGNKATFTSAFTDFGSDTKKDYGVRLMSCYKWDTMPYAEIAQGHNSAFVDHKGRAFVVYHTRQNTGDEGHSVRVHQLFQTQDGWLVAAPFEFAGETLTQTDIDTKQLCSAADVAGDYQLIFHKYRQDATKQEYEAPVNVKLNADGTVSGNYTGSWSLVPGTGYINITLNGSHTLDKNVTFTGVVTRQTVDYTDIPAVCISVLSSDDGDTSTGTGAAYPQTRGMCVWGVKADAKAAIKFTLDNLNVPKTVKSTLNLSNYSKLGATVSFTSGNKNILSDNGRIVAPGTTTIDVCISKDGCEYHKQYEVTVEGTAADVYYPSAGAKDCSSPFFTQFSESYVIQKGKTAEFCFINHNKGTDPTYCNWVLVTANNDHRGQSDYREYVVLRNDAYAWDSYGGNTNSSLVYVYNMNKNFNEGSFVKDMNGAHVDMFLTLTQQGNIEMNASITTTSGKLYDYSFTCDVEVWEPSITVFFTVEKSYIEGDNTTDIAVPSVGIRNNSGVTYNLSGQKVNDSFKGVVVKDGRKYIRK